MAAAAPIPVKAAASSATDSHYRGKVLSERDRILLAPHLALLRAAEKELAAAHRAVDEAEEQAADSATGTDWRDRTLGGLLSVDEGRARRYRQARGSRKAAGKAMDAAKARYDKYAERMDGLLEPILVRDDAAYRAAVAAVRVCDNALRACVDLRFRVASAVARPARQSRADRGGETWHEAEFARRRFDELVAELQSAVPTLRRTIDRAARALGDPPPARPALEVPGGHPTALAAEQHLRGLQRQLDGAVNELTRWRARADEGRASLLRAAHHAL